jgi:5-(carboxyamino)imidazole ribonucleotide mutase
MKVALILGSASDFPVAEKAFETLKNFDIMYEAHIFSAHRTPDATADFSRNARERGFGVIIAFAGMAAHLAGAIAAHTTLPVIGVPCKGGALDGLDALLSTAQMPEGIPVATVALNGGVNAALLAAEILSLSDTSLAAKLADYRRNLMDAALKKDAELNTSQKGKNER